MYDEILYPTDGSSGSEAAAEHVREIASAFDATVHVLYVVDARHLGFGMSGDHHSEEGPGMTGAHIVGDEPGMIGDRLDAQETTEALVEQGREFVERAAANFEGMDTEPTVVTGNPHASILEYVDDHDIDLVVMGTHGRTGVDRYLLGSVTEKVVRMSDAPVVTVRGDEGTGD